MGSGRAAEEMPLSILTQIKVLFRTSKEGREGN